VSTSDEFRRTSGCALPHIVSGFHFFSSPGLQWRCQMRSSRAARSPPLFFVAAWIGPLLLCVEVRLEPSGLPPRPVTVSDRSTPDSEGGGIEAHGAADLE